MLKQLERFIEVYNSAVVNGYPTSWVAKKMRMTRREVAQFKHNVLRAERRLQIRESCLKGKINKSRVFETFVFGLHNKGRTS